MIAVEQREASQRGLPHTSLPLLCIALLLGSAGTVSVAWSQTPLTKALLLNAPAGPTNVAESASDLRAFSKAAEKRLAEARTELAATKTEDPGITNRPSGISLQDSSLRRALLERLVRIYEQQISYAAELEAVKNRRTELARQAQSWTGFSEPRPYSILLTDSLREAIQIERLEVANGESALSMLTTLVDQNRTVLKQAEERIRQINEQLEGNRDAKAAGELTWHGEFERLRSQTAAGGMAALDLERQIRQERLAGSRIRLGLLERQLVIANAGARFTEADMEKVTARLEATQRDLQTELALAETRRRAASQALDSAAEELRRIQAQPVADPSASARAAEQIEVRRAQLETADVAINVLRFLLEALNVERAIWEVRFAAHGSGSVETIRQTERQLDHFARRVDLWKSYYRQQSENASSQLALQEGRLADLNAAADLVPLVRERVATLRERDQLLLRIVRHIERGDRLIRRLGEEMREAAGNLPFSGRVRNIFSDAGSLLGRLWGFEVFVAQDTITVDGQQITGKRSVTLGKIISAILILVIGIWVSDLLSRVLEPVFVKRFKIEANQANLIRRWVRVVLVFSLTLFSLVSVKIPLTMFAFAGGALAIGLGFGMQTILKNFVSGIIILFERPFRVGDVLDVAGQRGTVVSVGIRSSVLQLWDGTETLIPNSALLENAVTNWTYSNAKVRFVISVGVAYGSDTRLVVQTLTEIPGRHGLVEKDPAPQVFFVNFADSSLSFELRFWVNVRKANSAQVASDLRQMIANTFGERGIVMAYPHRDVHVDSAHPLRVQILPIADAAPLGNGSGEKAKPPANVDQGRIEQPVSTDSKPAPQLP